MRPARKSRERGLFKECKHLSWDRCECPWLGRFRGERRVNLATWSGNGKRSLTRSEAIDILTSLRTAILNRTFSPEGKALDGNTLTVNRLLDDYERDVEKRGLTGNALRPFIKAFRAEFGDSTVAQVSAFRLVLSAGWNGCERGISPCPTQRPRPGVWFGALAPGIAIVPWGSGCSTGLGTRGASLHPRTPLATFHG